jgi:drug/metabolite transporter (DMT)-like permease
LSSATAQFFTRRSVVFACATLACLLWGSAYPSIKSGYALMHILSGDIPGKLLFAGYRFFFAGLVLLVFCALSGRKLRLQSWQQAGEVCLLGLLQTSLQYVFFYIGLAYTTGVKGSIMNGTGTFFSVLMAHFIYHNDRLSVARVIGCLVGFGGVMVVNLSPDLLDFHFSLAGEGSVVLAAFILSVGGIYGKRISQKMDSITLTGYQLTFGGAVLLAAGWLGGGHLEAFTLASGSLMAYMVFLSAVAFALWTILLKFNRVGMISVFNFLIPIFGAALSAIFLGERIFEWKNLLALILVCGGIWLVTKEPKAA